MYVVFFLEHLFFFFTLIILQILPSWFRFLQHAIDFSNIFLDAFYSVAFFFSFLETVKITRILSLASS